MKRSGTANLPLHYGHVPKWLADRMREMGREITLAIIESFGRDEFLRRISDPFWFQALGAVMGMDWHSSGITTSVMGALRKGLNPLSHETGIYILGGRGKHSRNTPAELTEVSMKTGLDGDRLVLCSRLSAKIDNTCIQDGYQLYLHNFILTSDGKWAVVQQGMNNNNGMARRYHWHSEDIASFVDDPHSAIVGENQGEILNLSDSRAEESRRGILGFMALHPDRQSSEIEAVLSSRELTLPSHHDVRPANINRKRLGAVLAAAYDMQFRDFTDALLLEGVGPRTIQALALVSEVIYGAPSRFSDPARFSFAHGGKDGHPAPVPLKVFDESISTLKKAVKSAKLGNSERLDAMRKLDLLVRHIETDFSPEADVEKLIIHERRIAKDLGGRTVFDDRKKPESDVQLKLF
ncbi:MAG TPA: DUF763 domain-containing protein [Spirochaetota bacterium]|nr:DUF763 domain-containing protein [Spirochaetota bacterium]